MKNLICLVLLSFPFLVHASCGVFVAEKTFFHAGLEIHFDFSKILEDKNYYEVMTSTEYHDYEVHLKGEEPQRDHFHFADTSITFSNPETPVVKGGGSVRCYTQNCSVSDFAKSFNKAMRNFAKNVPPCQDSLH